MGPASALGPFTFLNSLALSVMECQFCPCPASLFVRYDEHNRLSRVRSTKSTEKFGIVGVAPRNRFLHMP